MLTINSRCWLCHSALFLSHQGICSYCLRGLPPLPTCCPRCGLPSSNPKQPCGRCLQDPPPWQTLVAASRYLAPIDNLLHRFKYSKQTELHPSLARLMLLAWQRALRDQRVSKPDLIIYVPLTRRRQWQRGFNQAELLAEKLAFWLNYRLDKQSLTRIRSTPAQQILSARQRQRNLQGAFVCRSRFDGINVLLIDDVVTTGSTLREISQVLLEQGASSVQICCLCRTFYDR